MLKILGYLLLTSAAVTLYVDIRQHPDAVLAQPIFRIEKAAPTPIEEASPGEIVIARFNGGTIAERWGTTPSPSPTAGNH